MQLARIIRSAALTGAAVFLMAVVVVVAVSVWVLQATGLWGPISSYRLTR